MRGNSGEDNTDVIVRRSFFDDGDRTAAYGALMRQVFGLSDEPHRTVANGDWVPFGLFDTDGRCIACVEAAVLDVAADGARSSAMGLRRVAVAPDRRGRGLFRRLMREALDWCADQSAGPVLLYTEAPALYAPFGFSECPQHAFVGPAPDPLGGSKARPLDIGKVADFALVRRCLAGRGPVSNHIALLGPPSLFLEAAPEFDLAFVPDHQAVVAYEIDGDGLTIADVAGASIPPLAVILGALGRTPVTVTTLFPPDRLQWSGRAISDETGLMTRGERPEAMARPFMLPPTAEF